MSHDRLWQVVSHKAMQMYTVGESERICPTLFASNGSDSLEIVLDGVRVANYCFYLHFLHCHHTRTSYITFTVFHLPRFVCLRTYFPLTSKCLPYLPLLYLYEFFIHCGCHRDFYFFFKYLLHLTCWFMYLL